ncbi:MAG: NnrU protein [Candidatus Binatia bacterium]|nr:MAG: NnrU protein [Candidatus Binatia bacterium]
MPAWSWILVWWLAFAGSHLALSSFPLRTRLVARFGERGFQGLYSAVAFLTFLPLVVVYARHRHTGPVLWWLRDVPAVWTASLILSGFAVVLLVLAFFQPSPVAIAPGPVKVQGVLRITRHPLFSALGLWGLGHLLVNGFLSDVLFFGGFAVFSFLGSAHQDVRKLREGGRELEAFYRETSLLPFVALLRGRTSFVPREIPWFGVLLGLLLAAVLYVAHPYLFAR